MMCSHRIDCAFRELPANNSLSRQFGLSQHEKILPELNTLKGMIDAIQLGRKMFEDFLTSDEGEKQFELSWLRQSQLVALLSEIGSQIARPDGWAALTTAGQQLRQHASEELSVLKERYGHKTLKALILATELFDVLEEPTAKGGIRVFYRLKAEHDHS
jgi:hypothetical protein